MTEPATRDAFIPRQEDIAYIMQALSEGACCSIVGMSNIGKSHLLRSLRRPEIRRRFLGNTAGNYILVYVDFNLMWEMTDQGFYEVILRGITSEIEYLASDTKTIERVRQAYQELISPASSFLIPVSFNEGLMALNPGWERRLVLLLDEFDEPWANIDRRAFLNLRALRDRYQQSLCYVTATDHRLSEIRPGREIGEFCELFAHHTRYLAPLSPSEARQFVQGLAQNEQADLDEADIRFLLDNAGGHPGLLEAACHAFIAAKQLEVGHGDRAIVHYERIQRSLDSDESVRTECVKLWNDLSESEQEALIVLLTNPGSADQGVLEGLQRKHLLHLQDGRLTPFSKLLASFVLRQGLRKRPKGLGVRVDVDSGDVWVDGKLLPPLTDLEYRLLLLLYGNLNKICDKYEIVRSVWGESYIDEADDARIEKLVSRLRQKMGESSEEQNYLITVRGRGYKLVSPEI